MSGVWVVPAEEGNGVDYGIAWSRDEVREPIDSKDIQWFETEAEARREFKGREDKYWPSVLVRSLPRPVEVVERGSSPFGAAEERNQ